MNTSHQLRAARHLPVFLLALPSLCAFLLLAGCATPKASGTVTPAAGPEVRLGPPIELVGGRCVRDKVKALRDHQGGVHVLVASTVLRQVSVVRVSQEGTVHRRIIQTNVSPWNVDGMFDAQGRLHVLVDVEHWVEEGDRWQPSDQTPWKQAGVKAKSARFLSGAGHLIWAFEVKGSEVGTPLRMEILMLGGAGGGIIFPWFTRGSRTVVVAETDRGFGPWVVVEPGSRSDTVPIAGGADRSGDVHLVYAQSSDPFPPAGLRRHLWIRGKTLSAPARAEPGPAGAGKTERPLVGVEGEPVRGSAEGVATDWVTGDTLVGMEWLVRSGTWHGPLAMPPRRPVEFHFTHLSPGGTDTFHAVHPGPAQKAFMGKGFPIRYSRFDGTAWSGHVEVAVADVASFWGFVWEAIAVVGVDQDRAFVVWPSPTGIFGRWIERIP